MDTPAPLIGNNNILLIQWLLMFVGLGFSVSVGKNITRRMLRGSDYDGGAASGGGSRLLSYSIKNRR